MNDEEALEPHCLSFAAFCHHYFIYTMDEREIGERNFFLSLFFI